MVTMVRAAARPIMHKSDQRATQQLHALQTAERRWSYALLRLLLGVDLFGHGFIRILHGTAAFAAGIVAQMANTPLPPALVHPFALAIPWIELVLGTLLILGLFTRTALTLSMLFMIALMVGITLRQDWPTAGLQLIYGLVLFVLLFLRRPYQTSWPRLFGIDSSGSAVPDAQP